MIGYGNSVFLRRSTGPGIPPVDPDAQAFITAAAITDPTQQAAINTLVVDLKGYNIWTKMKAIYPMVGGTSTSTSYNLKNPAQFQISWQGGVTWNANGVQFGGVNGYGITGLTPSTNLTLNNGSLSFYSRTNGNSLGVEIGTRITGSDVSLGIYGTTPLSGSINTFIDSAQLTVTDTLGFYQITRTGGSTQKVFKNTSSNLKTISATTPALTQPIYLGCLNNNGADAFYSNRQCAFASIGDGLTDTEAANFYTAVQAFQVSLGRSIGTQTVSDADAQAFVTNAGIVDQVEANAINNLVIGMKADGLWTKFNAIYPMVGGTATTMKFNLKNPLDTDAAFRAVFNGGWTYSNNGILGNASNSFADTKFNPTTVGVDKSNFGVSIYSRSNISGYKADIGAVESPASYIWLVPRYDSVTDFAGSFDDSNFNGNYLTNTLGLISVVRDSATTQKLYQGGIQKGTRTGFNATGNINKNIYFGARNNVGVAANYTDRQYALIAIHEAFNATEMINFNTRITTFQTALNRNI